MKPLTGGTPGGQVNGPRTCPPSMRQTRTRSLCSSPERRARVKSANLHRTQEFASALGTLGRRIVPPLFALAVGMGEQAGT